MSKERKVSTKRKEIEDQNGLFIEDVNWKCYLNGFDEKETKDSIVVSLPKGSPQSFQIATKFQILTPVQKFTDLEDYFMSIDGKFRCVFYKGKKVSNLLVLKAPSLNVLKRTLIFEISPEYFNQVTQFGRLEYVVEELFFDKKLVGELSVDFFSGEFEFDLENLEVTKGRLIKIYFYLNSQLFTESKILCLREQQSLTKSSIYLRRIENELKLQ